jgi:CRISPR-associated protein Csd1
MLAELYKYAKENEIDIKIGFKKKHIAYYIEMDSNGDYICITPNTNTEELVYCPDLGNLGNCKGNSQFLVAKSEVIFNTVEEDGVYKYAKSTQTYRDLLAKYAEYDENIKTVLECLTKHYETIRKDVLDLNLGKNIQYFSYKIDGVPVEQSKGYQEQFLKDRYGKCVEVSNQENICYITGERTRTLLRVPQITEICRKQNVYLMCCNAKAYGSYGMQEQINAPVSEEAMYYVNAALQKIAKETSVYVAGKQYIYWYAGVNKDSTDIIDIINNTCDYDLQKQEEQDNAIVAKITNEEEREEKQAELRRVRNMFNYIKDGKSLQKPEAKYYMMLVSVNVNRIRAQQYECGTYDDLYENIKAWYDDLKLQRANNKLRYCRFPKLYAVLKCMLGTQAVNLKPNEVSDKIATTLGDLPNQIMYAILHNTKLPDLCMQRALQYVRSEIYNKEWEQVDAVAYQILKAGYNRNVRQAGKGEEIMESLNTASKMVAYNIGRLIAVYNEIQRAAYGDVNASVLEKYYASVSKTPAMVLGRLAQLSNHHMSAIKSDGLRRYYEKQLDSIWVKLPQEIPKMFTVKEQTEFALGYYQQRALMHIRKEKDAAEEEKTEIVD